jgi:hypothetical protein
MQKVFINKDCIFDYTTSKWSVFVIVDDDGEPVRVEASREHVERVFGVAWMDRSRRKRALEAAVETVREEIAQSARCGPDRHRVYRLG